MKKEGRHTVHSKMGISHCFCTEVSLKEIYGALKKDIGNTKVMPRKERGNHRDRNVRRSYPYARKHTTEHKNSTTQGMSQGKKYANDL